MSTTDRNSIVHLNAQETLIQNGALFRALIENSSDIIVLLNDQGLVTYISPSITPVMGYSAEGLLGHHALELVHPDDLERMQHLFVDVLHSPRQSLRTEYRLQCQNGSWRWFDGVWTNLLDDPQVEAIVGNFRDITERKHGEEVLAHG